MSIALDDFGTGYSSLDTLRSFPFDRIKLDQSFVADAEAKPQDRAIIRAVLALGKSLGIPILAEGIETHDQLALLADEGCDEAQGFLLGRPAPQRDRRQRADCADRRQPRPHGGSCVRIGRRGRFRRTRAGNPRRRTRQPAPGCRRQAHMKILYARMARLASLAAPARNPDLLAAQYRVFAGQIPVSYLILISSRSLAVTHLGSTPWWLSVAMPAAMTLAALARLLHWHRTRLLEPTPDTVMRALTVTNWLVIPVAVTFTTWALLLFPYGDAWQKAQVAFYMAITMIGCVFSLMYLRTAALSVALIVNVAFIVFFISTGQPTLVATAVNMAFVSASLIAVISVNYRSVLRTVDAQDESRLREQAQTRLMRMIDDMPVAVMTADPETFRINYLNATSRNLLRSIEHLLPIRADDALGASIDFFHPHPQHQRRLLADPANLPHRARIPLGPEVLDIRPRPCATPRGATSARCCRGRSSRSRPRRRRAFTSSRITIRSPACRTARPSWPNSTRACAARTRCSRCSSSTSTVSS